MSFRRHSRAEKERAQAFQKQWSAWLEEHAALVAATGLPALCFEPDNWTFFLEHGYLLEGNVNVDELSVRQKAALLRLIMTRPIDLPSHVAHLLIIAVLDAVEQRYQ